MADLRTLKKRKPEACATLIAPPVSRCMSNPRPIGVFDSGIGGLTVVRALRDRLPNETIVYLGDTARVPYGPKSPGYRAAICPGAGAYADAKKCQGAGRGV